MMRVSGSLTPENRSVTRTDELNRGACFRVYGADYKIQIAIKQAEAGTNETVCLYD